jgi:hypothetical protein
MDDQADIRDLYDRLRQWEERFHAERDRRYAEVALEREKALKIKETGDNAALKLAREIQTYKDEKANELRSQIERERVTYATKEDLKALTDKFEIALKPLNEYVSSQQGRQEGIRLSTGAIVTTVSLIITILGAIIVAANVLT